MLNPITIMYPNNFHSFQDLCPSRLRNITDENISLTFKILTMKSKRFFYKKSLDQKHIQRCKFHSNNTLKTKMKGVNNQCNDL